MYNPSNIFNSINEKVLQEINGWKYSISAILKILDSYLFPRGEIDVANVEHGSQYLEDGLLLELAQAEYVYGRDESLKVFGVVFVVDVAVGAALIQVEIAFGLAQTILELLLVPKTLEQLVEHVVVALVCRLTHDPGLFEQILRYLGANY